MDSQSCFCSLDRLHSESTIAGNPVYIERNAIHLRLSLNPKQGITCHPLLYLLVSNPKLSNLAPDPNPTRFHMGQMEKVDFRMPA